MGFFRVRKSIRICPGVKLNIGKKGIASLSVGKAGATVNLSSKGVKGTAGIPGTGISYTSKLSGPSSSRSISCNAGLPGECDPSPFVPRELPQAPPKKSILVIWVVATAILAVLWLSCALQTPRNTDGAVVWGILTFASLGCFWKAYKKRYK